MDFLINGLPENESHEKKSTKKSPSQNSDFLGMDDIFKSMGIQPIDMSSLGAASGLGDINNIMNQLMGMLDPSKFTNLGSVPSSTNMPATNITFENGESKAFLSMQPASVSIIESEDIKSDFCMINSITSDDNISVDILKNLEFTGEMSKDFFLENIDHFGITGYGEKYILCNAVPVDPNDLGVFFAIVRTPNDFEVIIPKYGNTYFYDDSVADVFLYNTDDHSEMFENGVFRFTNISKIRLGLEWMLYTEKQTRFTPTDFGTIKPILSGAEINERDGSVYVYIGHLISNDSGESQQFKKDIGCENTKVFDFYVKFKSRECQSSVIAKVFGNISDFNTCNLFKNADLNARGSALYIDLDLGAIPKYLYKILINRVDDNDYMY